MGDLEEVQELMKVDMSALNDQMASMMEAMLGMKRLMESNAATVLQLTTSPVHYPASDMRGRGKDTMGHANSPHLGYNQSAYSYGLPPTLPHNLA